MNVREQIRAQMGEEGVKQFDQCRKVQEELHGQLQDTLDAAISRIGETTTDKTMSMMMLMSILEAASCTYADAVAASAMTLAEQDEAFSRQSLIHTAVKSLLTHLKDNFEHADAIASGVEDKIKEAARKGAKA